MFRRIGLACVLLVCVTASIRSAAAEDAAPTIIHANGCSFAERLAAQEIRRYFYLTTGKLIAVAADADAEVAGDVVLVVTKRWPAFKEAGELDPALLKAIDALKPDEYLLKTIDRDGHRLVLVVGGGPAGTLYGAYRLAEQFGVRFYLHGDVVPDGLIEPRLPTVDITGKPLFSERGILPFHDFPEGPDWWNLDDYKAHLGQLPKLGMNFFGLHTYPESNVGPEPLVWIGSPEDVLDGGRVKASYPARHFSVSGTTGWFGYQRSATGQFPFGAAVLFDQDDYGADYLRDTLPMEKMPPEQANQVFLNMGKFVNEAFTYAHRLHIKTCIGTETPLIIPTALRERLKAAGKDPSDPAVVEELYEGMFERIKRTHPLDYYWLWTDENWTWTAVKQEQIDRVTGDMRVAMKAMEKVKPPFTLATCGWVLGPPQAPALFDQYLPKNSPLSCINRTVGNTPVEPGFASIEGRPKWAIPWLEDDGGMTIPQLWAGRMRCDAADALNYGCTGLMGIHWRTEVLGPNVSALAKAAWDQTGWKRNGDEKGPAVPADRVLSGEIAQFPNNEIADTEEPTIYQTVRYNLGGYQLKIPNGTYTVTLKFCEPHYSEKEKRVFGVKLQGKAVIESLDIFAKVGQNRALDYTFKDVQVADGLLKIDFVRQTEFPSIAAIVVNGTTAGANQFAGQPFTRKINCGGPAYKDYEADLALNQGPGPGRYAPIGDFYLDWAKANFGLGQADAIAKVFARLDGYLPRPADWVTGPGSIRPDTRPWEEAAKAYAFIEELEAVRGKIEGPGNQQRFDYWLNQFRYLRDIGRVRCAWCEYDKTIAAVRAEKDIAAQKKLARETALPVRVKLIEAFARLYCDLLATVSTPGEMGNVANWSMQTLPVVLQKPGEELAKILGEDLPPEAMPSMKYTGVPRLFVPTVRTGIAAGDPLKVKAILLGLEPKDVDLYWRPLGEGEFNPVAMQRLARGGYVVTLPADELTGDFEYYVEAKDAKTTIRFPVTAPERNQSVIVVKE